MNLGFRALARALLLVLALACLCVRSSAAPAILITNLPPYGTTADLYGYVAGVAPADYRVAVFTTQQVPAGIPSPTATRH